jgi:hypothetical protein
LRGRKVFHKLNTEALRKTSQHGEQKKTAMGSNSWIFADCPISSKPLQSEIFEKKKKQKTLTQGRRAAKNTQRFSLRILRGFAPLRALWLLGATARPGYGSLREFSAYSVTPCEKDS